MESQLHKKHEVYFSNYLISIPLLKHLKNVGVRACVTIKANRKFLPTYLKQGKTMLESDFDYRVSCTVILIIVYRDFDYRVLCLIIVYRVPCLIIVCKITLLTISG